MSVIRFRSASVRIGPQKISLIVQPSAHQSAATGMRESISKLRRESSGDWYTFGSTCSALEK